MILRMQNLPAYWIQPDWPTPTRVRALMTSRQGGVSAAPWDSMNLGDHVGDRSADVHTNRERLAVQIGQRPVFLQQVHGVASLQLGAATPQGAIRVWPAPSWWPIACQSCFAMQQGGGWLQPMRAGAGWRGRVSP